MNLSNLIRGMDPAQVYYYNHRRKEILEGPERETVVTGKCA